LIKSPTLSLNGAVGDSGEERFLLTGQDLLQNQNQKRVANCFNRLRDEGTGPTKASTKHINPSLVHVFVCKNLNYILGIAAYQTKVHPGTNPDE